MKAPSAIAYDRQPCSLVQISHNFLISMDYSVIPSMHVSCLNGNPL